jgi:hypothetical protein
MLRRDVSAALFASATGMALVPGPAAAQSRAAARWPQTATESSLGIAPVNTEVPPCCVDRYATNAAPGITDMWQAITHADAVAAHDRAAVIFTPGALYGVDITTAKHHARQALQMTTHWVCHGAAARVRRIDYLAATAAYTVQCLRRANLFLVGLVFDGQVTALEAAANPRRAPNVDLGPAGSFRDDGTERLWSQPYGVHFAYAQDCTIENCRFENFLRAGLRIDCQDVAAVPSGPPWSADICRGNRLVNCTFVRNRGVYGDGFYAEEYEDLLLTDCVAYDYQRIGFVFHLSKASDYVGANGTLVTNCVADYGHDAVTSASQSNAGFWLESGDSYQLANCESKNTMIGYVCGFAGGKATGLTRPWTGSHVLKGCAAIRCRQQGFRLAYELADIHAVLENCFIEVNRTAAPYANCVGGAPAGVEIDFTPQPGESAALIAARFEVKGCAFDMVGFGGAGLRQYSAINVLNGGGAVRIARACQQQVDIRDCSFRWIASGTTRATDGEVRRAHESEAAPDYGYIGDIIFSGLNNRGVPFAGAALIANCVNHSFGYLLFMSEIAGESSILTVRDTTLSMRTGGGSSNAGGSLLLENCRVDMRGQLGWELVSASGCRFLDLNPGHPDRTAWRAGELRLSNCLLNRQLRIAMNGSSSGSRRPLRLTANGTEWHLDFAAEPGLRLATGAGTHAAVNMSGCTFRHSGNSRVSSNAMILCDTTTGSVQFAGAGNTFDASFVSDSGGHCLEYSTDGPRYNDAPQTVAVPFLSAFGIQQRF